MNSQRNRRLVPWTGVMALLVLPGLVTAQSGRPPAGEPVNVPTERLPQSPEQVLQPVPATPESPAPPGTLPAPVGSGAVQPGEATGGQFQQPGQPSQIPAGQPAAAPFGQPEPRAGVDRGGLVPDFQEVEGVIVELNSPGESLQLERLRILVDVSEDWASFSAGSGGMADPNAPVPGFGRPGSPAPAQPPAPGPDAFQPDALDLPAREPAEPGDQPLPSDLPPVEEPGGLPPIEPEAPASDDGVDPEAACDLFFDPQDEEQEPSQEPPADLDDLPPAEEQGLDGLNLQEDQAATTQDDQAGNTMEFVITARTYIYSFERAMPGMDQAGLSPPQRNNFTNLHEGVFVSIHYRPTEEGVNEVLRLSMIRTPSGSSSPAGFGPGSDLGAGAMQPGAGAAMQPRPGAGVGVDTIDPRFGGIPTEATDENPLGQVNPGIPSRPPTSGEGSASGRPSIAPGVPTGIPTTPGAPIQPAVPGPGLINPPTNVPVIPNTPVPPVGP